MRRTMTTAGLVLALANLPSLPARADPSPEQQIAELDTTQAALLLRLNRTDEIGSVHGRYTLIRDTYLYGDKGLAKLAADWFQKSARWVNDWDKLLAMVDANPGSLSRLEVQNGIRDLLKSQQDAWSELKREALVIGSRAQVAKTQVKELRRFPRDYVEHYEAHLDRLNEQIEVLSRGLDKAGSSFTSRDYEAWDDILAKTDAAVQAKLRKVMLQYPELRQVLARVDAFFQVERQIEPHVRRVRLAYKDLSEHVLAGRYFHAKKSLSALQQTASDAQAKVRATGLDAEFSQAAIETVQKMAQAGANQFAEATRSFTPGMLVATYFQSESADLAAQCRDATLRKNLKCDLLRTFVSIPAESLVTLSAAQLEYIEYRFDAVKAGPLPQGRN